MSGSGVLFQVVVDVHQHGRRLVDVEKPDDPAETEDPVPEIQLLEVEVLDAGRRILARLPVLVEEDLDEEPQVAHLPFPEEGDALGHAADDVLDQGRVVVGQEVDDLLLQIGRAIVQDEFPYPLEAVRQSLLDDVGYHEFLAVGLEIGLQGHDDIAEKLVLEQVKRPRVDGHAEKPDENIHDHLVEPLDLGRYGDEIPEQLVRVAQAIHVLVQGIEHHADQVHIARGEGLHGVDEVLPVVAGNHGADEGDLGAVGIAVEIVGHLSQENPDVQDDLVLTVRRVGVQPVVLGLHLHGLFGEVRRQEIDRLVHGGADRIVPFLQQRLEHRNGPERRQGLDGKRPELGVLALGIDLRDEEIEDLVRLPADRLEHVKGFAHDLGGDMPGLERLDQRYDVLDVLRPALALHVLQDHHPLAVGDVPAEAGEHRLHDLGVLEGHEHRYRALPYIGTLLKLLDEDAHPHVGFQDAEYLVEREPLVGDQLEAPADFKLYGL